MSHFKNFRTLFAIAMVALLVIVSANVALAQEPVQLPDEDGWTLQGEILTYKGPSSDPHITYGDENDDCTDLLSMRNHLSRETLEEGEDYRIVRLSNSHTVCEIPAFEASHSIPVGGMPMEGLNVQFLDWTGEFPPAVNVDIEPNSFVDVTVSVPACRDQGDSGIGSYIETFNFPGESGVNYYGWRKIWSQIDTGKDYCDNNIVEFELSAFGELACDATEFPFVVSLRQNGKAARNYPVTSEYSSQSYTVATNAEGVANFLFGYEGEGALNVEAGVFGSGELNVPALPECPPTPVLTGEVTLSCEAQMFEPQAKASEGNDPLSDVTVKFSYKQVEKEAVTDEQGLASEELKYEGKGMLTLSANGFEDVEVMVPEAENCPEPQTYTIFMPLVRLDPPPPPADWKVTCAWGDPHVFTWILSYVTTPHQKCPAQDEAHWGSGWHTGVQTALLAGDVHIEFDVRPSGNVEHVVSKVFLNGVDISNVENTELNNVYIFITPQSCGIDAGCLTVNVWWKEDIQASGLLPELFTINSSPHPED